VIVTNAHLARGEESLHTLLPTGRELEAKSSILIGIDIALVKSLPLQRKSDLPHLTLADALPSIR